MLSFYQLPIEKTFLFTKTKLSSIFEYKQNTSTVFVICTFNFPTVKSDRYTEKISINELPLPIHNQTVFLNYHQNQSCNKQKSQNTDTTPCTLLRQKKQEHDHHQCCTDYHLCNSKPEEEKLKFTIIKTLNTILKKYYNNQKFDQEIDSLKILCKNNDLVLNDIKQLENFLNINSKLLLDTFDTESKNLIVNSENSILKNLIKIKKISDKNTLKTTNSTIKNIRSSIINNDLQLATDLIINNNYQDKLAKTLELIQENQKFLVLLNSIIQNI